jgi:hypothetical protein
VCRFPFRRQLDYREARDRRERCKHGTCYTHAP